MSPGKDHHNAGRADAASALRRHVSAEAIPADADILFADQLAERLTRIPGYDALLLGDVMLGERAAERIAAYGPDYPFAGILPLLRHARLVVANLEAPFATAPRVPTERYSYRVDPRLAECLQRAGISAVNLANNHLLDCGPAGVCQTIDALKSVGIGHFGAGINADNANEPLICKAGPWRFGFLGYYWNPRCRAATDAPGCASSDPNVIQASIRSLRPHVDCLVASFHWGQTYGRQPSDKARMKARLAIESGADVVIGHHPHVLQPLEWHCDKPIFYSIGNCLMGSGNSKAEGIAVGISGSPYAWRMDAHVLYVKNRDARVDYQSKILTGNTARRATFWLQQIQDGIKPLSIPLI